MIKSEEQIKEDIPKLKEWDKQLLSFCNEICYAPLFYEDPSFKWLSLHFLRRQCDHMRVVLKIADTLDAWLIVRSMLEGMTLLLWTAQDAENRATQFREFAHVIDWRTLRENKATGDVTPVNWKDLPSV